MVLGFNLQIKMHKLLCVSLTWSILNGKADTELTYLFNFFTVFPGQLNIFKPSSIICTGLLLSYKFCLYMYIYTNQLFIPSFSYLWIWMLQTGRHWWNSPKMRYQWSRRLVLLLYHDTRWPGNSYYYYPMTILTNVFSWFVLHPDGQVEELCGLQSC